MSIFSLFYAVSPVRSYQNRFLALTGDYCSREKIPRRDVIPFHLSHRSQHRTENWGTEISCELMLKERKYYSSSDNFGPLGQPLSRDLNTTAAQDRKEEKSLSAITAVTLAATIKMRESIHCGCE